jgi:uncharacterized Rmd1/YagE family protein
MSTTEDTSMQIDTSAQEEETKELEEDQQKNFIVDLLIMVKSAQNQNGLRHNDYGRYHKYCVRKIYRLRRALKFTQGKKQYVQKLVSAEEASKNNKYLHILVFKCEAHWAYAMQMKQVVSGGVVKGSGDSAKNMANRNPNRVKFHAKKRLQKAH